MTSGEHICPNYSTCKLANTAGFAGDEPIRTKYISKYCRAGRIKWSVCKRYIVKEQLHFCPDFVLPDTELSPDEIMDKFDEESSNK